MGEGYFNFSLIKQLKIVIYNKKFVIINIITKNKLIKNAFYLELIK